MGWSLSTGSAARFRRLSERLQVEGGVKAGVIPNSVALANRRSPAVLVPLHLPTGKPTVPATAYDLIVVDLESPAQVRAEHVRAWKEALAANGVIAIRMRANLLSRVRSMLRRRRRDREDSLFVRGLPRSEAAVRMAGLYVGRLSVTNDGKREEWVIASGAPWGDRRFRDTIGRVATDYLRSFWPVAAVGPFARAFR